MLDRGLGLGMPVVGVVYWGSLLMVGRVVDH